MAFAVIDPTSGETLREQDATTPEELARVLESAQEGFTRWKEVAFDERATVLRQAADILRERADEWGGLMTEEMGKPIAQARGEAKKCAWVCEYYAEHGEDFLAVERVETDAARSYVAFEPLGVVLSIMPWNFPFWQVFRFGAPALMAGNAVVLKHASNVPGCGKAIESVLTEAGLPDGVFQHVLLDNDPTEELIEHETIRAVTLTGSTRAGRAVAKRAGGALKKSVLELGGSDPYVVLADADLDSAVEACVKSRLNNSGQSCIAAKRFIVVQERAEAFIEKMVDRMSEARMGDPRDEATEVGPLAREDLRDGLHDQVLRSVDAGARLRLGGAVPERGGWFYPPTVLTEVGPGMPAYDEELFGPVAAVSTVADEDEAIRVANDNVFGLGGAVFSGDEARAELIARKRLNVGCAFVNDFVRSDPRLPFGGVKDSGYGRELGSFGIREFVNVKTVWVAG